MQIEYKRLSDLVMYENNPRNNDEAVQFVAESIKEFGFKVPIIIDVNNVIVAGHTRYKACKLLDIREVPCIIADDLTEEQIRAYRLADNKVSEIATWDFDKLELELSKLQQFDMTLFNFDEGIGGIYSEEDDIEVIEDDYDEELPEETNVKLGDIYQLGNHRLMCGDSTDKAAVTLLMNGNKVDMVFTDPPYDMSMGGGGCFAEGMQSCKKRIENIINFNPYVIEYLPELDIGSYYICTSKDGIPKYLDIFKEHSFNICVWCKTNPTPFTNGTFLPDIEYIMYFAKSGKRIWNNSLKPTEIYKKYYISDKLKGRKDGGGDLHPTMKPLELIANKIKISSNEEGIVLDIFGGSGSTMIACEQLNRNCYMMELDPRYVQVIINRWEEFTGRKAVLLNGNSKSIETA